MPILHSLTYNTFFQMHSTTFFLALIAASTAIAVPLRDGATTDIVDKRNNHLGARDAAAAAAGSASRKKT